MEAYQQRVLEERDQLSERLDKLRPFLNAAQFAALPRAERARMTRQYLAMSNYLDILNERIKAFQAS